MHCKCCDNPRASYIREWEDWYCEECLDIISELISEDEWEEEYYDVSL